MWGEGKDKMTRIHYIGKKPLPRTVHIEDGYAMANTPHVIMKNSSLALFTLTREYFHPDEAKVFKEVSQEAIWRWRQDRQRFAAKSYETPSLAWRGKESRQWNPRERAQFHGLPARTFDALLPAGRTASAVT